MKAIGFFREPGQKKGDTLAAQNKAFLEFCEQQGYDVAVTFVETAETNGHRSGFRQLLDYLRRPEHGFIVVVARSLDVMGNDRPEAVRRYFQLQSLGAQVAFVIGPDDPISDLVREWQDDSGRERLGDRVRAAMRRKAVRGEVLGRPPYGYRVGMRRRLELVPDEAVLVRHIFRLYLHEGLGIRLIARRLNEEGHRTRRGGNWSMVSIRDILRNRVYLGTYSRFGVRVPGSHPALITPDDFRAVQDRLNDRRNNYSKRQPSPFLLAGIVQCGHCGHKMIGVSRRQSWKRRSGSEGRASYRYYQCESRTNQSMCDYHTQRADELEEQVRVTLATNGGPVMPDFAGNEEQVRAEWEEQAERLRNRLRTIDRRFDDQFAAAAKGRVTHDQLQQLSMKAAAQRLELEEELEDVDRRIQEQADASERLRNRRRALSALIDGWSTAAMAEKQSLLREVVDRVVVKDEGIQVVIRP